MFQDLLTNKYFTIALIVLLAFVIFMHLTQMTCDTKEHMFQFLMSDTDKTPNQKIYEPSNIVNMDGKYQYANYKGDKASSKTVSRIDQKYNDYIKSDTEHESEYFNKRDNAFPSAHDSNPELGNCQPCKCDDKKSKNMMDMFDMSDD
jgi:hypothetical protein